MLPAMRSPEIVSLTAIQTARDVIAGRLHRTPVLSSAGAEGAPAAGPALGAPVPVVMPAGANRSKAEAAAGYGARVILEGDHVGETFAAMDRIRAEEGLIFCHPYDDPHVIAGHGSAGLELLEGPPHVEGVG